MSSLNNNSICLQCKTTSRNEIEKEFHEIFDETGLELNLPSLVKKFFNIKVTRKISGSRQLLCDDCVNRLIELVDLEEHSKQQCDRKEGVEDDNPIEAVDNEIVVSYYEEEEEGAHHANAGEHSEIPNTDHVENTDHQFYTQAHPMENADEECKSVLSISDHSQNDENSQKIDDDDDDDNDDEDKTAVQTKDDDNNKPDNCEYEEVIVEEQYENSGVEYYYLEEASEVKAQQDDEISQGEEAVVYEEYDEKSGGDTMDGISEYEASYDDIISIDEEYLIEEAVCSEEYDNIDLSDYLNSAIITKFEELDTLWTVDCELCLETCNTFQELLRHACIYDERREKPYCCVLKECDTVFDDLKSLARHFIYVHFENVEHLTIYGRCPECQKTFSNIIDFNKHSCSNIKRKPGVRNYCAVCDMDFQSLKRFVFHMQFHLTKHRPKVCLLCGLSFNNSDAFFDHVTYVHMPASTLACKKCDRFFSHQVVYERHMQGHKAKIVYECSQCPKIYTTKFGLTNHMEIYHFQKTKPLQCEYCNREFVSQSSYRTHLKVHMPEENVPAFICSLCGLVANNVETIKSHIETDEDPECEIIEKIITVAYTCENCSFDFETPAQLHEHRQSASHDTKLFHCALCRNPFRTLQHMRNHVAAHKEFDDWQNDFPITRYYMCDIGPCREAYPLWTSLYYHKKRHKKSNDKNFLLEDDNLKCQFCERLCPTKMSLAIHVARVHNNNHVKCSFCNKMYKSEKDLKEHIDYMHTSVKCPSCERLFKNRRNLRSHEQLVHFNKKRFFCAHCTKGYYYKSEKDAHERNVHPDVPLNCNLCNFVTNYPKSMDIHMAKHNDKLPYKCSICTKQFGRKQLLQVHEKRHEKHRDYVCKDYCTIGCKAAFITLFLLKKHIKQNHPNDVQHTVAKRRMAARSKKSSASNVYTEEHVEITVNRADNDEYSQDTNEDMAEDDEIEIQYDFEDDDGDAKDTLMAEEEDLDEGQEEHIYEDDEDMD